MKEVVNHFISAEGIKCKVESSEIKEYIHRKYNIDKSSIISPDYCYNRINKGTPLSHPVYLEYIEHNRYRCLGEGFPYDGQIKHKAKKEKRRVNLADKYSFNGLSTFPEYSLKPASIFYKFQNIKMDILYIYRKLTRIR